MSDMNGMFYIALLNVLILIFVYVLTNMVADIREKLDSQPFEEIPKKSAAYNHPDRAIGLGMGDAGYTQFLDKLMCMITDISLQDKDPVEIRVPAHIYDHWVRMDIVKEGEYITLMGIKTVPHDKDTLEVRTEDPYVYRSVEWSHVVS